MRPLGRARASVPARTRECGQSLSEGGNSQAFRRRAIGDGLDDLWRQKRERDKSGGRAARNQTFSSGDLIKGYEASPLRTASIQPARADDLPATAHSEVLGQGAPIQIAQRRRHRDHSAMIVFLLRPLTGAIAWDAGTGSISAFSPRDRPESLQWGWSSGIGDARLSRGGGKGVGRHQQISRPSLLLRCKIDPTSSPSRSPHVEIASLAVLTLAWARPADRR